MDRGARCYGPRGGQESHTAERVSTHTHTNEYVTTRLTPVAFELCSSGPRVPQRSLEELVWVVAVLGGPRVESRLFPGSSHHLSSPHGAGQILLLETAFLGLERFGSRGATPSP